MARSRRDTGSHLTSRSGAEHRWTTLADCGTRHPASLAQRSGGRARRGDPLSMFDRLGDEMERLFESFGFGRMFPSLGRPTGGLGFGPGRGLATRGDLPGVWAPLVEV